MFHSEDFQHQYLGNLEIRIGNVVSPMFFGVLGLLDSRLPTLPNIRTDSPRPSMAMLNMNVPELLQSLTISGFTLGVVGGHLEVRGPLEELTNFQRNLLKQHKNELLEMVGCFSDNEESRCEREAIQFAQTPEAFEVARQIIADWERPSPGDHLLWVVGRIQQLTSLDELEVFSQRMEQDLLEHDTYRPVAREIRSLIDDRMARMKITEIVLLPRF